MYTKGNLGDEVNTTDIPYQPSLGIVYDKEKVTFKTVPWGTMTELSPYIYVFAENVYTQVPDTVEEIKINI